jgi:hypothetical protein
MTQREQTLVDVCFSCVALVTDPEYRKVFEKMSLPERMEWVAKQLREMGFPTHPAGASWGVLDKSD